MDPTTHPPPSNPNPPAGEGCSLTDPRNHIDRNRAYPGDSGPSQPQRLFFPLHFNTVLRFSPTTVSENSAAKGTAPEEAGKDMCKFSLEGSVKKGFRSLRGVFGEKNSDDKCGGKENTNGKVHSSLHANLGCSQVWHEKAGTSPEPVYLADPAMSRDGKTVFPALGQASLGQTAPPKLRLRQLCRKGRKPEGTAGESSSVTMPARKLRVRKPTAVPGYGLVAEWESKPNREPETELGIGAVPFECCPALPPTPHFSPESSHG
ncbi:hypothetical protein BU23DRAFT_253217 [Bimuria novae-zelandiae CBS 107.79]|uniref:Uncharacterized protein n=1 Tax=Bimuria novae-zelandiae CBS 107.79 TaxID=1447943 RepID=A0A6A5VLR8_9PLEO|nr:hypothetical protein BU23DRAFT_253217 [Bimuria novae-zelandiae CBS 107.79]